MIDYNDLRKKAEASLKTEPGAFEAVQDYYASMSPDVTLRLLRIIAVATTAIDNYKRSIGGHDHFDPQGTAGRNCPTCIQQRIAREELERKLAEIAKIENED